MDYKFLIIDIETNGIGSFRPPRQRPIQISFELIKLDGSSLKKYSKFIKNVKKIQWGNSIGNCPWSVEFLNKNGIPIEDCMKEIENYLDEKTICVGHNIDFDIDTLLYHYDSDKLKTLKRICTMKTTTNYCKIKMENNYYNNSNNYKWPKLYELADKLKIEYDYGKFHDSNYDVEITKKCFLKLFDLKYYKIK